MLDDCDRDAYLALDGLIDALVPPPITLAAVHAMLAETTGNPHIDVVRAWSGLSSECLVGLVLDICMYRTSLLQLVAPAADVYLSLLVLASPGIVTPTIIIVPDSFCSRIYVEACASGRLELAQAMASILPTATIHKLAFRLIESLIDDGHGHIFDYLLCTLPCPPEVLLQSFTRAVGKHRPAIAATILARISAMTPEEAHLAASGAAANGYLSLFTQLVAKFPPLVVSERLVRAAIEGGNLAIIESVMALIAPADSMRLAMTWQIAASTGRVAVLDFLERQGSILSYHSAMIETIANDQIRAFEWLLARFTIERVALSNIMSLFFVASSRRSNYYIERLLAAPAMIEMLLDDVDDEVRTEVLTVCSRDYTNALVTRFLTIPGMRKRLTSRAAIYAAIAARLCRSLVSTLVANSTEPNLLSEDAVVAYM